jgi:hypothetical protein
MAPARENTQRGHHWAPVLYAFVPRHAAKK